MNRLPLCLFLMRLGVAVVFVSWTLDKFINPGHAAAVWSKFYLMPGLEAPVLYGIGAVQLVIVAGFLVGAFKTWTYGAILFMHTVSTLSSWKIYLAPYEGPGLLFFAAWPMLSACIALFLLRDQDTMLALKG